MASLNKVFLVGNLTRNPELRYTPGGAAVCEFGMAMNRTYTSNNEQKEEVCFVDVTVWGKQAEACDKYLQKGAPLLVEGRLHLDQWTDKESQKQRSRLKVVAERTQFIGAPRGGGDFQQNDNGNSGYGGQQQQPSTAAPVTPPAQPYNAYGAAPANSGFVQQTPAVAPAAPTAPLAPATRPSTFAPAAPVAPAPTTAAMPAPPPTVVPAAAPQPNNAFSPNVEGSEDDIPF